MACLKQLVFGSASSSGGGIVGFFVGGLHAEVFCDALGRSGFEPELDGEGTGALSLRSMLALLLLDAVVVLEESVTSTTKWAPMLLTESCPSARASCERMSLRHLLSG